MLRACRAIPCAGVQQIIQQCYAHAVQLLALGSDIEKYGRHSPKGLEGNYLE